MRKIFENPHAMDSFLIKGVTDPRIRFFYAVYKEDYFSSMPQSGMPKKLIAIEEHRAKDHARYLIKEEGKIIFVAVGRVPTVVPARGNEGEMRGKLVMSLKPLGYISFSFVRGGTAGEDAMIRCDRIYLAKKFRDLGLATRMVMRCFGRACMLMASLRGAYFEDSVKYRTKDIIEAMRKKGLVEDVEYMTKKGEIRVRIPKAALEKELRVIKAYERYVSAKGYKKPFEFIRLRAERRRYGRSENDTKTKHEKSKDTSRKQSAIRRLFRR